MKTRHLLAGLLLLGSTCCSLRPAAAQGLLPQVAEVQTREVETMDAARQAFTEIMAIPAKGIPQALLARAQGIAILPGLVKGGFVVGIRHGRGVIVVRDEKGDWKAPVFIAITGGSVGWQAGLQAADLILVFQTKTSVENLTRGKFTIGGNVAAAAGPVGRQVEAGTDARLKAEILSYSRSRGLFAGVALDGSVIQVDRQAQEAYYAASAGASAGQPSALPPSAVKLLQEIAKYTAAEGQGSAAAQLPGPGAVSEADATRRELADSSRQLVALIDAGWQQYLALPAAIYGTDPLPPVEQLRQALTNYDRVASDARYRALAEKAEFQRTHALLKKLCAAQTPAAPLALPPPPTDGR